LYFCTFLLSTLLLPSDLPNNPCLIGLFVKIEDGVILELGFRVNFQRVELAIGGVEVQFGKQEEERRGRRGQRLLGGVQLQLVRSGK
jgi:hypothetical protein